MAEKQFFRRRMASQSPSPTREQIFHSSIDSSSDAAIDTATSDEIRRCESQSESNLENSTIDSFDPAPLPNLENRGRQSKRSDLVYRHPPDPTATAEIIATPIFEQVDSSTNGNLVLQQRVPIGKGRGRLLLYDQPVQYVGDYVEYSGPLIEFENFLDQSIRINPEIDFPNLAPGKGRGRRIADLLSQSSSPGNPPATLRTPRGRGARLLNAIAAGEPPILPGAQFAPDDSTSNQESPTSAVAFSTVESTSFQIGSRTYSAAGGDSPDVIPKKKIAVEKATEVGCCGDRGSIKDVDAKDYDACKRYFGLLRDDFGGSTYIDTHCHIDRIFTNFGFDGTSFGDFRRQYHRQFSATYEGCIADFCYPNAFFRRNSLWKYVTEEENVYLAYGCHPHNVDEYDDDVERFIIDRMSHPKSLAIGEMGLDYSGNNKRDHDLQKRIFRKQMELAVRLGKPLLIHCRNAEADCFNLMKEVVPHNYPIHRHCFLLGKNEAYTWINYFTKLKLGLTTGIAHPRHYQLGVLRHVPLDRLLIETDAPFFLPYPYKMSEFGGLKNNHPGWAYIVGLKIAEEREMDYKEVFAQIRQNTRDLYGI